MFCTPRWRCWSHWYQRAAQSSSPLKNRSSHLWVCPFRHLSSRIVLAARASHHWCSHSLQLSGSPPYWWEPEGGMDGMDSSHTSVYCHENSRYFGSAVWLKMSVTCLACACTPPSTSWPEATSSPSCPEMYIVRSTITAWLRTTRTTRSTPFTLRLINVTCACFWHNK